VNERKDIPEQRPWYREVWPWLLMLPPALSVVGGVMMLTLAIQSPNALVVDDYARIEELTSERFARDRVALGLDLTAELRFEPAAGRIELVLDGATDFEKPELLRLYLRHATNPAEDRTLSLARTGEFYIAIAELATGRYFVELMPDDLSWRLASDARSLEGVIVLGPQIDGV
jgi:hypothetical protein